MDNLHENIDKEIKALEEAERNIDTATHDDCKKTLHIIIPVAINILKLNKKLVIATKNRGFRQ